MKKIYFACSIRGGGDTSNYVTILDAAKNAGAEVISEIFVHDALNFGGSPLPDDQIYERDTAMIRDCDAVIAEVTNPSLGVGYELASAENLAKPILCLFDEHSDKKLSPMIAGNRYFTTKNYASNESIAATVEKFLRSLA